MKLAVFSLFSLKCPYGLSANAIAEAGYKIIKTECAFNRIFKSLEELRIELANYVLWYNYKRIHGSLNYMTPIEYRLAKAPKQDGKGNPYVDVINHHEKYLREDFHKQQK